MSVWGWVGTIAAGWFTVSILFAVAWALGARKILRQPPKPPRLVHRDGSETEFSVALRRRAGER